MNLYTFPKALHSIDGVTVLLHAEDNCILHKKLHSDVENADVLIVSHVIVFVVNGKVEICTDDGKHMVATNGEMLFMPRDSYMVSDYVRNGKDLEVFLLFFNHDIALSFLGSKRIPSQTSETICKLEASNNIYYFFDLLQKMEFSNKNNKELLTLKILEFLYLVVHDNEVQFIETLYASERHKQKRDITTLMLEHLDKNLTVSDYASLSGMSLSTFNRKFKEKYHTTPKSWLIEQKMYKAFKLLKEGNSVTQSAFDVGYLNVSNFIKAYKSVYGHTPKSMQINCI